MFVRAILKATGRLGLTLWLLIAPQQIVIADEIRLLVLGDSLSAGYGLPPGDGFTDKLEAALRIEGQAVKVLNGGVSGDTTAGGLARLEWMLSDKPDAVLVELGANDGLRGLDPTETHSNLNAILNTIRERDIPVLLAGMFAPPNMGSEYGADFNDLYPLLAGQHDVVFYPFFLEGVAGDLSLNQEDALHPNVAGVDEIIRRILPSVIKLLERM
ncbi:MAG: arylesterase [Rhodospirillales bacterium]|jgi:acyl-CoA thioesterase I|nr:arylesterase [Rhodospirillales bacterium]